MLATEPVPARIIVLGDPDMLAERCRLLGLKLALNLVDDIDRTENHRPGTLQVLPVRASVPVRPGRLDPANAEYVLELLTRGAQLCTTSACSALVTAPVQKSVINEAGHPFTGHTEWLAQRTNAPLPVMMLVAERVRVALATTHLPLSAVAAAISAERLEQVVTVLDRDLRRRFGLNPPRIMVLGLNPHAGERGVLGPEEREILEPVLAKLSARGLALTGPIPADTAFTRQRLQSCDVVLAMYHDQGLPVIKALAFGEVVNVTLGLPIIRTSVDHGTALELAGSGTARHESLRRAVALALELAARP